MRSRLHESLGYWRFFLSVSIFCYIYFRLHFFRPALVVFLPSSPVRRSSRSLYLYLFRIQCMLHFKLDGLMRSSSTEWMGWVVSMLLASTWIEKSWINPKLNQIDESYCSEWDTEREKERGEGGKEDWVEWTIFYTVIDARKLIMHFSKLCVLPHFFLFLESCSIRFRLNRVYVYRSMAVPYWLCRDIRQYGNNKIQSGIRK